MLNIKSRLRRLENKVVFKLKPDGDYKYTGADWTAQEIFDYIMNPSPEAIEERLEKEANPHECQAG